MKLSEYISCISANGLGLCVRAGFGVQNFQPALMPNRSTTLELTTSARMTQNECYGQVLLNFKISNKMAKQYIGSQDHFEDEINAYYDQKEEMEREMQKQYEKEMMEQMERDYYEQQPNEG